jgi:hypothetical protein
VGEGVVMVAVPGWEQGSLSLSLSLRSLSLMSSFKNVKIVFVENTFM